MSYILIEQGSQDWFVYKAGRIGGTAFGQVLSDRENGLIEELANQILDGYVEPIGYINDDMQFGLDNESEALDKYEKVLGKRLLRGGVMQSDIHKNHMASPDAISEDGEIVVEVKSTRNGSTQLRRYLKGIDNGHKAQVINYFAVSPMVKEVHHVSYCPFRPERELVVTIFTRDTVIERKTYVSKTDVVITVQNMVDKGLERLPAIKVAVEKLIDDFNEIKF